MTFFAIPAFSPIMKVMMGAVLISFSGVWVKLSHVSPTVSAFYRLLFGGGVLIGVVLYRGRPIRCGQQYFLYICLAALLFSLDLFTWHRSIYYIGMGLSTILANFQVFFLSLAGILFLKERLGINRIAGILFAMVGLFLIVGVDWRSLDDTYRIGVYLGLSSALFYSGYILSLKRLQGFDVSLPPESNLMLVSLVGAGILGFEAGLAGESFAIPDGQTFWALLCMGIFGQVLGWVFISSGLGRIRASLAGLILLLQPALAFIWDILFFHKPVSWHGTLGACISLSAIYLGSLPPRKPPAGRS